MDFKQAITINDNDYMVYIKDLDNDESLYEIIVIGNGNEYKAKIKDDDGQLNRLKNSLRQEKGLSYRAKFENNMQNLELKPYHELIKIDDKYNLERSKCDISINLEVGNRLKKLEDNFDTEFVITKEMLGACVTLTPQHTMSPDIVNNYILDVQVKNDKMLPYRIEKFYKIEYLYQEELPVKTKNQVLINKILSFGNPITTHNIEFGYTLLSKKYNEAAVGFIQKNKRTITIELNNVMFDIKAGCPDVKTEYIPNSSSTQIYCDSKSYFKYCYLLKLPFEMADGIYNTEKYSNALNEFVLIKNNYVYSGIQYLKDNKFYGSNYTLNSIIIKLLQ